MHLGRDRLEIEYLTRKQKKKQWKIFNIDFHLLLTTNTCFISLLCLPSTHLPFVTSSWNSRPDTTFLWFMSPLKAVRYLVCTRYKWLIIKIILGILLVIMVALFIYSMPGYLVKKMLGAWRNQRETGCLIPTLLLIVCRNSYLFIHNDAALCLSILLPYDLPTHIVAHQAFLTFLKNFFLLISNIVIFIFLPTNQLFSWFILFITARNWGQLY